MRPITFLFGIHNHQPVGNFDHVIEDAYRTAYLPFLEVLERHPGIRLSLHSSGILLDWFEDRHPDYLDRVRALVEAGRVELVTGGFYEPVLPAIPDADKTGQIGMLTRRLRERLGGEAVGLWLTERVWEPSLVLPIRAAGVEYLMVDDAHFIAAGLTPDRLWNYWMTEDQGETLAVWPISQELRYLVPFEPPERTIEFLRRVASAGRDRVVLLADDGEKFGVWPDTHRQVYEDGWLDTFFGLVEENAEWLRMELPGDVLRSRPPEGRIYLPTASYSEMMEWSLPTEEQLDYHAFRQKLADRRAPEARFVRGGFWRNFLAKYPESNLMHKRMLETRRAVLEEPALSDAGRAEALDLVWQSQCNCAYWHGIFGGLYLPHLRDAVYRKILAAESRVDAAREGGRDFLRVEERDVDRDGCPDIRIRNARVAALIAPGRGGGIEELDFFPAARNLTHGMTRRREAYHRRLAEAETVAVVGEAAAPAEKETTVKSIHDRVEVKEKGLEKMLFYDWYRRQSLLDHFFRHDSTMELFDRGEHGEQGNFIESPYAHETIPGGVRLDRSGTVWTGGHPLPVRLAKTIVLDAAGSAFRIDYRVSHDGSEAVPLWFGVEFNFSMLAGNAPDRYAMVDGVRPETEPHLAGRGVHESTRAVSLVDAWDGVRVSLDWSRSGGLWRLPVETISQSENGFERVYQSTCLVPNWRISLAPGAVWSVTLNLAVTAVPPE